MKPYEAESNRPASREEDIAIVGMACFFPGSDTAGQYWENIVHKVDCVGAPPDDWQPDHFLNPAHADRSYTGQGGYLRELCRFNPAKYGIVPNSIEGAEPDHFLAFRCAVEALADAGYPEISLDRERTGVILGRGIFINRGLVTMIAQGYMVDQMVNVLRQIEPQRGEDDFALIRETLKKRLPPFTAETVPGLTHNVLAARIANRLDLQGPTYTVDAACASTLLAVEHGMRELRAGRCGAILAGGVQVSTPGMVHQAFSYLQALSRTGKIAPFSAEANGTLLGQGCGVVVLKRRSDAERDGNRIYALLKAVGISSDGKAMGLLAPRQDGQELSIRRAYEQAEIEPSSVELIEAHGTGIPLGDQTEIRSLTSCFGAREGGKPNVAIGSVKSMISHLIPASAAASLIKTALALYHRVLPPMLHAEQVNPALGLDRTPFYICTEARPWVHGRRDVPRRAAIDAFGFGGINAHAVLEEHASVDERQLERFDRRWPAELVVLSADDRSSLRDRAARLLDWLEKAESVELLDVAGSLAGETGSSRLAIVAKDPDDLRKKLATVVRLLAEENRTKIQDRSGIFWYAEPLAREGRVAFLFPGEGAQYTNMLADLCQHFPEVRREFDLTDAAFAKSSFGQSLSRLIFPLPEEREQAERELLELGGAVTSVTLASRGLLALMSTLGVKADAILGHSSGEFGALMAAGVIAPQDEEALIQALADGADNAVKLAQSGLVPPAVLTAVGGARAGAVDEVLEALQGRIVLAMDNCPSQQVLVGDEAATAQTLQMLRGKGGLCERLPWGRAYHTAEFGPALGIIEEYYDRVPIESPHTELWSCVTADRYPRDPDEVKRLAIKQWATTVRMRETVEAMYEAGVRVFVEVGPRGNLSAFVADTLRKQPHAAVPLDLPRYDGLTQLARALGMLVAHGVAVNLPALFERRRPGKLDFSADPPPPAKPDPVLRLDLPTLTLSDEALQTWRKTAERPPAEARQASTPVAPAKPDSQSAKKPPAPSPSAAPPSRPPAESPRPSTAAPSGTPARASAPGTPVSSNGTGAAAKRAAAFAEYQKTMRAFLDMQRRVMSRGLAGVKTLPAYVAPPAPRPTAPAANPARETSQANGAATMSNGASMHRASTQQPSHSSAVAVLADVPAVAAPVPVMVEEGRPVAVAAPPATDAGRAKNGVATAVMDRLVQIVSDRTGYPPEMLDVDASLEADLGIDSIKRVEVISALRREAMPQLAAPPEAVMERLAAARTLREMADHAAEFTDGATDSSTEAAGATTATIERPALALIRDVVAYEHGRHLVADCEFDIRQHRFLTDHTLIGRRLSQDDPTQIALPVMPLAAMLELLAEAAVLLLPERSVVALSHVRTLRWFAFESDTRRVRVEAVRHDEQQVRVTITESDREGRPAIITEGTVEMGEAPASLGPPRVRDKARRPATWAHDIYERILFHGPAFQGVSQLEACDDQAVRATVVEPDEALMFAEPAPPFLLPVGLIDVASQVPGMIYGDWKPEDPQVHMVYPNSFERLEFSAERTPGEKLVTVATVRRDGQHLFTDLEVKSADERVVLRVTGRKCQVVDFPTALHHYSKFPERVTCCRAIDELFQGVPGSEFCTVVEVAMAGRSLLVERLWSQVVARLVLGREEQQAFAGLKTPPRENAAWLIARIAVKDAVRLHLDRPYYLPDVAILRNADGKPRVRVSGGDGPLVSLSHKGFNAVAVAADPERFRGVGIDMEQLGSMDPGLIEDSFTAGERALLEAAARQTGEPLDHWCLASWAAKEAFGKALGRGVIGGPRAVEVREVDAATGRISMVLRGPMVEVFPEFDSTGDREVRVEAYRRIRGDKVIALCLLKPFT